MKRNKWFGALIVLLVAAICLPSWLGHSYWPDVLMGMLIGALSVIGVVWYWSGMTATQKEHTIYRSWVALWLMILTIFGTGFGLLASNVIGYNWPGVVILTILGLIVGVVAVIILDVCVHPEAWGEYVDDYDDYLIPSGGQT